MSLKDLLVVGNGHGEDAILGRILDALGVDGGRPLAIDAWPMVGKGEAYAQRGLPIVGASNLLPSGGFATLDPRLMARDLVAGWISTHWRQIRAARAMIGRYRLILAAGDIVPIVAATLARTPFLFVGCAKSEYYTGFWRYSPFEKFMLRRAAALTFPRDSRTADMLAAAGVPTRYVGNPMMDGLTPRRDDLDLPADAVAIAMLPGTRADAVANAADLLDASAAIRPAGVDPARLRFVFAAHDGLDFAAATVRATDWRRAGDGERLTLVAPDGAEALFVRGRFNETLAAASLVVGMAGTANEQAVGLGLALIAVPSAGVQGENYVRMKAQYFGEAAVSVAREPHAIAKAVEEILSDPAKRARMAEAGRERMGEPGASAAIAAEIRRRLDA